ncbi:MAG: ATP-binding protein [Myxococcota bacterium]
MIRIVVVAGGRAVGGGPPAMAPETTAALARLGDPVELLRARTPAELARISAYPAVDLVLIDRVGANELEPLVAATGPAGPPVVVVVAEEARESALEAFRAGASDCVATGPDYADVLPVALLEQIRRGRTERQQRVALERIRWLEGVNAAIVAEMPAGLAVADDAGRIVAANPEFERLFPPHASRPTGGERLVDRLPAEFRDVLGAGGSGGSSGASPGRSVVLVRVAQGEGETRTYEVRRRGLDGPRGRELVLVSDVTESEWLSQRLETLQRDTRDIVESLSSALLVVDLEGRIRYANPAAEAILGGEGGDLGGRAIGDWFGHPGDAADPIEACRTRGLRSRGAEMRLRRSDGTWIPVGISCSPRLDETGRSQGVVAIFQDLSAVKVLEQQVRQAEKMASIGQLAAGLAHEVNNPIGFIQTNLHQMREYLADLARHFEALDVLQRAIAEGEPAAVARASAVLEAVAREIDLDYVRSDFEKALGESLEGADRIRHIVKDLRDFSRPDLPERVPTDVNAALESTVHIVQATLARGVVIEKDYGSIPEIEGYPMQLKQVFMNLLVNAHQAIEEARASAGEAGESVASRGLVRLVTRREGGEVVVRIEDDGVGIPPGDLDRIFEPYFTTKPVGTGTGLGLATCFQIVERHGGRIRAESTPGRGSAFELRLPIRTPGAGEGADASGRPTGSRC